MKRVVGKPGDVIQIISGRVFVNGEVREDEILTEAMRDAGVAEHEIRLGTDEYFVLGDNRNASSDSRDPSVGVIHQDRIIGRAWLRIWPFNKFGILKHQ